MQKNKGTACFMNHVCKETGSLYHYLAVRISAVNYRTLWIAYFFGVPISRSQRREILSSIQAYAHYPAKNRKIVTATILGRYTRVSPNGPLQRCQIAFFKGPWTLPSPFDVISPQTHRRNSGPSVVKNAMTLIFSSICSWSDSILT